MATNSEIRKVLLLIRNDVQNLYERVKDRKNEYLELFSVKRTRAHFPEIFKNRYDEIPFTDLKLCEEELLVALDKFYKTIDEMKWYLMTTEDMPARIDDRVHQLMRELETDYAMIDLYLNAQIEHMEEKKSEA